MPGKHPCPECRSWLQPVFAEGVELDVCVECHGVWFDRGELVNLPMPAPPVPSQRTPYYDPWGVGWYWGPRRSWGPAELFLLLLFYWWRR